MTDTADRTEFPSELAAVPILLEVHKKAQEEDSDQKK